MYTSFPLAAVGARRSPLGPHIIVDRSHTPEQKSAAHDGAHYLATPSLCDIIMYADEGVRDSEN